MYCGAQVSLYPMCDRFVPVILNAVEGIRGREGLRIETDDLSTLFVGTPRAVFDAVRDLFLGACGSGVHTAMSLLFSRGCPGEPDDPICTPKAEDGGSSEEELLDTAAVPSAGIGIAGQYSVYPLGRPEYMNVVAAQIEAAKREGTYGGAKHFATRLDGDCGKVFATLYNAFVRAARDEGHVVIHATLSANSPSRKGGSRA